MHKLQRLTLSTAILTALASTPSHAFFDELVIGMTSVTNNLIDSSESVTIHSVSAASNAFQTVSSNPGKMADRIGVMADRIGFMADRIVTTEGIMAGLAHKIIDSRQESNGYASGNHPQQFQASFSAPAPEYRYSPKPISNYSASQMIYGVSGATYTAATPISASSGYGQRTPTSSAFNAQPATMQTSNAGSCGLSYGVPLRC